MRNKKNVDWEREVCECNELFICNKKMETEMQHLLKMHNGLRVKHKTLMCDYDGLINVHAND